MTSVSILVPNYNHARFLDERLASIFHQNYKDFELIFLDDASSDNSVDVFRQYSARSNVRAILNDHNSGSTFRQWNRGVRAAKGRYIWIAESDDVSEPNFLETLVPILESHPQIGIACCNSMVIDECGEKKYTVDRWSVNVSENRWKQDYTNSGDEECRRYLICRNTIPNASAVVFRKSIYEQCGYANEAMTRCGDWWVWVQMLFLSDIAYVAAPLNLFRRHMALSHQTGNLNVALEETLQILHEIVARLGLTSEIEAEMSRTFVDHLLWRQQVANSEVIVLPSSILYQAALISERLYAGILEFVSEHNNWEIDWSSTAPSAVENLTMVRHNSNNLFQNLSVVTAQQQQEIAALKSERDRLLSDLAALKWAHDHLVTDVSILKWNCNQLLSSREYRWGQQLQMLRERYAPDDSVQYNCLRKIGSVMKRIGKRRGTAPGHEENTQARQAG